MRLNFENLKKYAFLSLVFLLFAQNLFSQNSNYVVIDSLITSSVENICDSLKKHSLNEIQIKYSDNGINKFLIEKLTPLLNAKGFNTIENSQNELNIQIYKFKCEYNEILDNEIYLEREIIFDVEYLLKQTNLINSLYKQKSIIKDTISYSDAETFNRTNYNFAKAEIPDKSLSFYKRYIEPIAISTAIIITTFLFFLVRS